MNKGYSNNINKLIFRYILEIILVVLCVIISYSSFTFNNLSSAQSIAVAYDNDFRHVQVELRETEKDRKDVLNHKNLIEKKELLIKNTNKREVYIDVTIKIKCDEINKLDIKFAGKNIDLKNATKKDEIYTMNIYSTKLNKYESIELPLEFYGDPFEENGIDYDFEVTESFYN